MELLDYDETDMSRRYQELGQYKLALPGDWADLGLGAINTWLSRVQAFMDRVQVIRLEATHMASRAKAASEAAKYAYQAKYDAILTSEGQQEYESAKMVEAKVRHMLADELRLMQRSKITAGLFAAYRDVVEGTYGHLQTMQRTLEVQSNNLKRMLPPPAPPVAVVGHRMP